ncbi:hypothetical protein ACLMJK_006030 [Lecanora helva]
MTNCYPPIRHHSTKRISTSDALSLLSAYLDSASTDPSLHPNALLTENGPITPSAGPNTGLVLHNLRRVEAGLKGEHLGADLTFEKYGGEGLPGLKDGNTVPGATEVPIGGVSDGGRDTESGWQDKEEFEREQDVVEGEIGKRDNAINGEDYNSIPKVKSGGDNINKDARKQAKKERRKKEKATTLAKKKREKDAEG